MSPLLGVAQTYIADACPGAPPCICAELMQIIGHLLNGVLSPERASAIFFEKVGTSVPANRIAAILRVPDRPIHAGFRLESQSTDLSSWRRRTRPWTEYEDQRLLCAIHRFGLENWTRISKFVGNQRTLAQCAQRWCRGLDPRISRAVWTPEEEQRLIALVERYGIHSWKRVSNALGNRSDAQCRYRYLQVIAAGSKREGRLIAPVRIAPEPHGTGIIASRFERPQAPRREFVLPPIGLLIGISPVLGEPGIRASD
jgi:hypothetical protein